MKNMQDTFSIDFACLQIQYLLSKQWIYTVSMPFLQIKSANIPRWNIFIIEVLSMLASPLIKMVKPPDKKPGISDRSSFLRQRSVELQHSPCRAASKACWLMWFIHKIPKILWVCSRCALWQYYEIVRFIETTTCQCRQLKLNPLSTQINIYCLMTNQTPALLVQCAPWARTAVILLQSLYFSHPPSPRAIIPDARPLGTYALENHDGHH